MARARNRDQQHELGEGVQRLYHDTPGISSYSPHKLVFGRDRNLAGVPYADTLGKEAED